MLDRQALHRWLREPRHTFRWHPERSGAGVPDADRYEGVEVTSAGLRWFRWSHEAVDGGPAGEEYQAFQDFRVSGPLWPVPEETLAELRAFLADHDL